MVALAVGCAIFSALVMGVFLGFLLGIAKVSRKLPGQSEFKPVINWKEIFKADPQPESKPSAVGAVPRGNKPWRHMRQDLQKAHNSVQKQRDSGLPSI